MEEDLIRRKAELVLGGDVLLPEGFRMPCRLSRSTAGPGAGSGSAVFSFGGYRVKKSVSRTAGEFELRVGKDGMSLTRGGEPFLEGVSILPVAFHCPEQAFFNLDQRCIFNCAFCASPRLERDITKGLTDERIVSMIRSHDPEIGAIALTSGVVGSVEATVTRMESCVRALKAGFPGATIGVEPYVENAGQVRRLREAGADEIKINVETATEGIFRRVCPELDRDALLSCLREAVPIFGRGRVASNLIFGLGETDPEVEETLEMLASMGVVAGLRPVKHSALNRESMEAALGSLEKVSPARMIRLAGMHRRILESHGLDTRTFRTMCFECTCCDLVPFRDL